MKIIKFLLEKEFRQIFRNPSILRMIIAIPVIQLLVLPLAADYEIKNINIVIANNDQSTYSQKLISKISASGYFIVKDVSTSYNEMFKKFEDDEADIILEIPADFEKDLIKEGRVKLFIATNAINGTNATVGATYLNSILQSFNEEILIEWVQEPVNMATIETIPTNWFNRFLNYQFFMVPGILVVLVTMVGSYMCSLNIVKEKEVGTIEQINVTPIKKYQFIIGKLFPFWIIGIIVFSIGLFLIAIPVYKVFPSGSLLLLYAYLSIYLIAILGIGLLISTYSSTQQQAMSLAFFCMMIFMLMSGLFTPIESMPGWAKFIAYCNPVTYFIEVMRMVVLKGSTFEDIKIHFAVMIGFAALFNSWAIVNYKKSS